MDHNNRMIRNTSRVLTPRLMKLLSVAAPAAFSKEIKKYNRTENYQTEVNKVGRGVEMGLIHAIHFGYKG